MKNRENGMCRGAQKARKVVKTRRTRMHACTLNSVNERAMHGRIGSPREQERDRAAEITKHRSPGTSPRRSVRISLVSKGRIGRPRDRETEGYSETHRSPMARNEPPPLCAHIALSRKSQNPMKTHDHDAAPVPPSQLPAPRRRSGTLADLRTKNREGPGTRLGALREG